MIICKIFGHHYSKLQPSRGICSADMCDWCGDVQEGIDWRKYTPEENSKLDKGNDILIDLLRAATRKANEV
ncbi:MAG: hypothetical protein WC679_02110 [Bacteroidales bacterium]|jgi:hypothetical protein